MIEKIKDVAKELAFPVIFGTAFGTLSYAFLNRYANGKGMQNADMLKATAEYIKDYDGKPQNLNHHVFETVEFVRNKNPQIPELAEFSEDLEKRLASDAPSDLHATSERMHSIALKHDVGFEELAYGIVMGLAAGAFLIGGIGTYVREEIKSRRIDRELAEIMRKHKERDVPGKL